MIYNLDNIDLPQINKRKPKINKKGLSLKNKLLLSAGIIVLGSVLYFRDAFKKAVPENFPGNTKAKSGEVNQPEEKLKTEKETVSNELLAKTISNPKIARKGLIELVNDINGCFFNNSLKAKLNGEDIEIYNEQEEVLFRFNGGKHFDASLISQEEPTPLGLQCFFNGQNIIDSACLANNDAEADSDEEAFYNQISKNKNCDEKLQENINCLKKSLEETMGKNVQIKTDNLHSMLNISYKNRKLESLEIEIDKNTNNINFFGFAKRQKLTFFDCQTWPPELIDKIKEEIDEVDDFYLNFINRIAQMGIDIKIQNEKIIEDDEVPFKEQGDEIIQYDIVFENNIAGVINIYTDNSCRISFSGSNFSIFFHYNDLENQELAIKLTNLIIGNLKKIKSLQ